MKVKYKSITPIITTILLVVVSVIMITIILSFGKDFTNKGLDKTNTIKSLSVSDAEAFVYPKSFNDGILQVNYQPPKIIQDDIIITSYKILEVPEMEPVILTTPFTFTNNTINILSLDCLYEYSVASSEMTIQLITEDNTYINIKQRDPKMVCSSGGTGTIEDPIIICDAEDLNAVRDNLDYNYALGKDIDLKCFTDTEEGWAPLGDDEIYFTGNLDGGNHTISNLYINRSETNYLGLFGYINNENSIIKDLGLEDVNIVYTDETDYVGGLVGYNNDGDISNCYSIGYVSGGNYTGGLVGANGAGDISNSYFAGSVYGSGNNVGGLVGYNGGDISNCYSTGYVSGGDSTGGLVGGNNGDILNNHSTSNVLGANNVGGLVGHNNPYDTITNSYCSGDVNGLNYVGCLVGYAYEEFSPDENSVGTGDFNCTEADCEHGCPVGYSAMLH